ncbi:hypothetical protein HPB52_002797 [Rhipicephalus sanguineus]|uniref:Nucleic-acid-binding protein from mobile element jockey n=1 Tax=Rhipicephalus sanguineus TaxID=34632 RepID=A0A9D4SXF8_RHISA|nr:hypothetical protein HPB52_002797 [Rhipicephalus sanguineus]
MRIPPRSKRGKPGATSGHSSKSSAENFSLSPAQGAPSKNISCLDAGLPEGQDDFSDMSDSSATITYMDASAYEPRPNNCGVGVIKGVPTDLDQQDIFSALLQRAPVKSVRRLGASENVRIVFATESAPEHVILGYTRYRVYKYIESPRECSKCQRFGHVAGTCRLQARCSRCGGNHERSSCGTEEPQCPNCKKKHESTSPRCRVLRKEKEIHNYKKNNNVGYSSAKAVVCKQRNASRRDSDEKTPVNYTGASEKAFETTPRIDDTDEFPSLPPRPKAQSSTLTTPAAVAPINVPTVGVQQSTAGPSTRPRSSYPWSGPRERSTRQGNETTFSLLSALVDAARSFLAPMSSPVAKAILTLLDLILPILEKWR